MQLLKIKLWPFLFSKFKPWMLLFFLVLQTISTSLFAFSAYSTDELEELEKEFVRLINQSETVERNPLAVEYINHIGKKLATSAQILPPYFFIVKSSEINAFAGPGGYIGINTQLILATENENELAAVMAHEMAHVRLHHLYYMLQHQKQMRIPMLASMLASIALGAINPTLGSGAMMASLTGFAQDNINFVRSNEKAADRIGIDMLKKAGFDPKGMAGFFKKMQANSRYYFSDNLPAILRTHPLDHDRIAEAENRSSYRRDKKFIDNPSYYLFKELIRTLVANDSKQLIEYYQHQCRNSGHSDACLYGYSLALLNIHRYHEAKNHLSPLIKKNPENLYYQIAMAESEIGLKNHSNALQKLNKLYTNYPDNYSAIMSYAKGLLEVGKSEKAARLLLKGSRQFKKDLPLCRMLARAQGESKQESYAYFTQSQCLLLEGRHREAVRQLKVAQKLAQNNPYLRERILAMIDEIKFMAERT
ncbi:M48 family metallopeptidase [Legionella israelensis]|uniref:M48 family metalloprotease n=1 Tax=Legionella israelensis TaxID=454 RepID=UPI00117FFFF4|nr:M48 family metallopeptidase [Legionella israelensis]